MPSTVSIAHSDASARRLAAIVTSSDDAIISKDLNGIVQSWNSAAERMFGYAEIEMVGQSILKIIPDERRSEEETVLSKIRRGGTVEHFETWRRRKDGTLIPISLTVSPVRDDDGVIIGASKIARDISDRLRTERMLARAEADRADLQRRLLSLVAASRSLVSNPDVEAVLSATMRLAQELIAADAYVMWREHGDDWALVRSVGVSQEFQRIAAPRVGGRPMAPPDEPLIISDVLTAPQVQSRLDAYRLERIVSLLLIPMRIGGRVSGTLAFYYRHPHDFTDVEVQTATALGNLAAAGLTSAEIHEQERQAREEARQANRVKDQFLATLSHELRTPLNAILGYTRMLLRRAVTVERHEHALRVVERNASSLAQIVDDVLDVSRIVSGKLALKEEQVDLAALAQHATETVAPTADDKGVRLSTDVGASPVLVTGDANRLQQVVWNLVTNAVKFTPAGGSVRVELSATERTAVLTVTDSGIGIKPEFLGAIFEPFRQADTRPSREYGGLGLGLAIARRIAELHGGTIVARSAGEGAGAAFELILPLVQSH